MDAAYDARRIRALAIRTSASIDALMELKSDDPAAADALRTIRLTSRNLEDHWMRALRDIDASDAMTRWQASGVEPLALRRSRSTVDDNLPDHLRPHGMTMSDKRRDELLGLLASLDQAALLAALERTSRLPHDRAGAPGGPTDDELDALAHHLAMWVQHDQLLRVRLIERSTTTMLVGELLGRARFEPSFVSAVITHMAQPNGPDNGVDRQRFADSFASALTALLDEPAACLDLLARQPTVLQTLASWRPLDQDVVLDVVVTGLHQAVLDEPDRLADGYRALHTLTRLANGALDEAINPGVAVGVATSLPSYIDTLAVAVNSTTDDSLFVVSDRPTGVDVQLGRYPDVAALFGVMLRDQEARAVFGSVTSTWTVDRLEAATSPHDVDAALTEAADFTQLLIDAGVAEQQQANEAALDTESRTQTIGGALLAAAALGARAKGIPRPVTTVLKDTGEHALEWLSKTEPDTMPGRSIGPEIHRQMVVTAVSMSLSAPHLFDRDGQGHDVRLTSSQRRTIEADLAAIDAESDAEQREILVNRMSDHIQAHVPAVAPALQLVSNNAAASRLNRGP